jgi:hypothetical protein
MVGVMVPAPMQLKPSYCTNHDNQISHENLLARHNFVLHRAPHHGIAFTLLPSCFEILRCFLFFSGFFLESPYLVGLKE